MQTPENPGALISLLQFCLDYFPLAAILSLIAGNVLMSIGWVK
jgi:hypothetical protein